MLGLRSVGLESKPTNVMDPASSCMFVSKMKPCMYGFKRSYGGMASGSFKQL